MDSPVAGSMTGNRSFGGTKILSGPVASRSSFGWSCRGPTATTNQGYKESEINLNFLTQVYSEFIDENIDKKVSERIGPMLQLSLSDFNGVCATNHLVSDFTLPHSGGILLGQSKNERQSKIKVKPKPKPHPKSNLSKHGKKIKQMGRRSFQMVQTLQEDEQIQSAENPSPDAVQIDCTSDAEEVAHQEEHVNVATVQDVYKLLERQDRKSVV